MRRTRSKRDRLVDLVRHRQENVPPGYGGIGDYHSGAYECDFVSPYTKSAQNLDADIMLVLQDWCSDKFLRKPVDPEVVELGHDPQRQTNKNLKRLLCTHFGIGLEQTYATNLFPFIKPGDMSADVPCSVLKQAASSYTVPEIRIIEPTLVVCLGLKVYQAVQESLGMVPARNLETAIASSFASSFRIENSQVWAQAHPSRYPGGKVRVAKNWRRMAGAIQF